jgi:tRNA A-37 threonylcarbamoyl transferase component Bud32
MSTTLGARYRLEERIGGGGMGAVWRAHDELLDREVAVKVIREHLAEDETTRARLRLEARLAGSLHHPAIVEVYDYGEHHDDGDTVPFLVMPLIDGSSLAEVVTARGTLTVAETMRVVADVADALTVAHGAGIVHRDLKPANILLSRSGRVMLTDFGIARAADSEALTGTGTLLGTADYLSPEQASGRTATHAADLYALGVVAHRCLTGAAPFHRDSDVATALAQLREDPPPLPDHVPPEVAALVEQLLRKDPSRRPTDAAVVSASARPFAGVAPPPGTSDAVDMTGGQPAGEAPATVSHGPSSPALAAVGGPRSPRRSPRYAVVGATAVALVAGGSALLSMRGPDMTVVPDVVGDTDVAAAAEVATAGLELDTTTVHVPGHESGEVVQQRPAAGADVADGTTVLVSVASGEVNVPKDDLVGETYADAVERLRELGLKASRTDTPSDKAAGTVLSVEPDTRATIGDTVALTVAAPLPVTTGGTDPTSSGDSSGGKATSPSTTKGATKGGPAKGKDSGKGKGKGKKK